MIRFLPTTSRFLHHFRWLTPHFEGNHNIFLSDTILLKTQEIYNFHEHAYPSVAHSLPLPLGPAMLNLWTVRYVYDVGAFVLLNLVPMVTALLLITVPGELTELNCSVYEPTKNFIISFLFLNAWKLLKIMLIYPYLCLTLDRDTLSRKRQFSR